MTRFSRALHWICCNLEPCSLKGLDLGSARDRGKPRDDITRQNMLERAVGIWQSVCIILRIVPPNASSLHNKSQCPGTVSRKLYQSRTTCPLVSQTESTNTDVRNLCVCGLERKLRAPEWMKRSLGFVKLPTCEESLEVRNLAFLDAIAAKDNGKGKGKDQVGRDLETVRMRTSGEFQISGRA